VSTLDADLRITCRPVEHLPRGCVHAVTETLRVCNSEGQAGVGLAGPGSTHQNIIPSRCVAGECGAGFPCRSLRRLYKRHAASLCSSMLCRIPHTKQNSSKEHHPWRETAEAPCHCPPTEKLAAPHNAWPHLLPPAQRQWPTPTSHPDTRPCIPTQPSDIAIGQ